jgi:TonB family protein
VRFSTALLGAAALHAVAGVIVWRTWPVAPPPPGEVVPIEMRAVDSQPVPPPAPAAPGPSAPAAPESAHSTRARKVSAPAVAPVALELPVDPAGETPVQAPSPAPATSGLGSAAGSGSGSSAGAASGSGSGAGAGGGSDPRALFSVALERIRAHQHYPELARRRRIEGDVVVVFRVGADGRVDGARIKTSLDPMLDEAALAAVNEASPLPTPLHALGEVEALLHFVLR